MQNHLLFLITTPRFFNSYNSLSANSVAYNFKISCWTFDSPLNGIWFVCSVFIIYSLKKKVIVIWISQMRMTSFFLVLVFEEIKCGLLRILQVSSEPILLVGYIVFIDFRFWSSIIFPSVIWNTRPWLFTQSSVNDFLSTFFSLPALSK